jgi:hypothetical protein
MKAFALDKSKPSYFNENKEIDSEHVEYKKVIPIGPDMLPTNIPSFFRVNDGLQSVFRFC